MRYQNAALLLPPLAIWTLMSLTLMYSNSPNSRAQIQDSMKNVMAQTRHPRGDVRLWRA